MDQKQNKIASTQLSQNKKSMPIWGKAILIYISSVILGLIVSSPMGKLYRLIEGPYTSTTIGVLFDESTDRFLGGFSYGYFLFLGLLIALFVLKFKKGFVVWLIGILYFILTVILTSDWSLFLYVIPLSLLGFLLGKLILVIYKKVKQK